jgi:hypothetical protein
MTVIERRGTVEQQFNERGRGWRRDQGPGRVRLSRSKSPKNKSPSHRFCRTSSGPEATPLSTCPVCLGRHKHPIRHCQSPTLWDNENKSHCSRNAEGRITDEAGRFLCLNWNQAVGCKDKFARHIHECSGCGNTTHGAQQCPLADKASTDDTVRR